MTRSGALVVGLVGFVAATPAPAVDWSVSGFGTLGYARSNESFRYQRFIDDDGTFKRDTVAGVQVDAKLNNEFGATVQLKVAPDAGNDRRYEASVSWAFVSWRPANDLLVRVGKQRIPIYLYSESYDVGTTYDFARLPTEMYSLLPNNDAIGLSVNKTWKLGAGELSVDGYLGRSSNDIRYWYRDGVPGLQDAGVSFQQLTFRGGGLVLDYKIDDDTFRIGVHRAIVRARNHGPLASAYPFVELPSGVGYYQVAGPDVPYTTSLANTAIALGADVALPGDFRVIGEFARNIVTDVGGAPRGNRGYLALLHRVGKWTPYVSYAFLRSPQDQRDFDTRLDQTTVPPFIQGAAIVNASQRAGADTILTYHQSSWAFGSSYAFSATSKLKAEFLRTHVADVSKLVDSPPGASLHDRAINVFSLSYSVVY